jgi:hypothetical protein
MALVIVITSPVVNAEDLVFSPRLTTGYMNYELETPSPLPGIVPSQQFKFGVALIGAGATLLWNHLYLDVYGQITSNSSDNLNLPILNYNEKFDGDVNDYSLAAGVVVTDNLSIYMGYKYNKLDASGDKGSESSFKAEGYFLGASYGWIIKDSGVLALNLAIADLDGSTYFKVPNLPINLDTTSDAQGLSYGVSWKSAINEDWGYSIALDGYRYNFKDIIDKRLGAQPGEVKQDIFTLRVSISYLFE